MEASTCQPGHGHVPVIVGKVVPPAATVGVIPRPGLVQLFAHGERVVLVVAPPGYGKTEAARQWVDGCEMPTAWLALDLLDRSPSSFWRHAVAAIRLVLPDIDDEPGLLLDERGPADPIFLTVLIAQIERIGKRATLVLDDISRLTDRSVLDGIAVLVDRIGHLLRLVIIGRSDPALPTGRWKSAGWLGEIREEHLRLDDDEALAVARAIPDFDISDDILIALNGRTEGWATGLRLALLSIADAPHPDSAAPLVSGSDRVLADYLVAEAVDRLPVQEREVALALSVLEWFDAELCDALLGARAVPIAHRLHQRGLFLTVVDPTRGAMRFHALFRELLESELRWRDPARRVALHREAAALWTARGDVNAAYHHLVSIDDFASAIELVMPLTLEFVDRGDVTGLAGHMRSLPRSMRIEDPSHAFDLAVAWLFAGDPDEAGRWCDRAEQLSAADPAHQMRLQSTRCALALMHGDVTSAAEHLAGFERLHEHAGPEHPIERRYATVGARVMLGAGRLDEATRWVQRARTIADPSTVADVTVAALDGWLELETGDLRRAATLARHACERADALGLRPHHGASEALVLAGWCHLAAGDLLAAAELAEQARADADALGWAWSHLRAGTLYAEIRRLRDGPQAALAVVSGLRPMLADGAAGLASAIDAIEAKALIGCGRFDAARLVIDRLPDDPARCLLAARLRAATEEGKPLGDLLDDQQGWSEPARLEAAVLAAVAHAGHRRGEELTAALETGRTSGWASPFLGHVRATQHLIRRMPLEQLHPAVATALRPSPPMSVAAPRLVEQLTPRELTVLALLPTHLSYAQIGERLYLSVNTIKTNLKSLYRKLDVTSRADAVEAAARLDLI